MAIKRAICATDARHRPRAGLENRKELHSLCRVRSVLGKVVNFARAAKVATGERAGRCIDVLVTVQK
jgi:hypothetical protein